jgi:hypothetical protein
MTITRGEFTRFSISGRLQLLKLYGLAVMQLQHRCHQIIIYKIFNFYVEHIITQHRNNCLQTAEPLSSSMAMFYLAGIIPGNQYLY